MKPEIRNDERVYEARHKAEHAVTMLTQGIQALDNVNYTQATRKFEAARRAAKEARDWMQA